MINPTLDSLSTPNEHITQFLQKWQIIEQSSEECINQMLLDTVTTKKQLECYRILSVHYNAEIPIIYCVKVTPIQKIYAPTLQLGQVVELAKPRIGILIPSLEDSYHLNIMIETGLVIDCGMYEDSLRHSTHGVHDIMKIWDYDTSKGLSLKQIIEQKPSWERE